MSTPTPTLSATSPATDVFGGETMGTTWSVRLVGSQRDLHALHRWAQAELDTVVAQMSTWEPDSDLSRFNRAPAGWHALPDALLTVLAGAIDVARSSDGAFDPTIGPLVDLWGFGPAGAVAAPPSQAALDAVRTRSGWQLLRLDAATGMALQPGGVHVDLSAIAKGFAADQVTARLRASGVEAALVEVGGELVGYGTRPDGTPWRVLVETDPERDDGEPLVIRLQDHAVATSGDRWHRYRHAGEDFSHTIDPRTGAPLNQAPLAVTVVMHDAMHADAWATALSVLGRERGMALARALGIAARFVAPAAQGVDVAMSPAFERHLDA